MRKKTMKATKSMAATACTGMCVYAWDGNRWTLTLSNCSAGCQCPGTPPQPGHFPGEVLMYSCVPRGSSGKTCCGSGVLFC